MKLSASLISALVLPALLSLTACESKVQQCNAFIKEANDSQQAFATLPAAMFDKDKVTEKTKEIRSSIDKVEAVELSDEKLEGFRKRWVEGLDGMAEGLEKISASAEDAKDPEKMKQASEGLQEASKSFEKDVDKMSKLIEEVNGYCSEG